MTGYARALAHVAEIAKGCGRLCSDIRLIAISKGQPIENLEEAFQEGACEFGENRLQEAAQKMIHWPRAPSCTWHFIGKLQTKKIAKTIPLFSLIHSVDSFDLVEKINEASAKQNKKTSILLQVNTSYEPSKLGLFQEEWEDGMDRLLHLSHVHIEGVMTLAPKTDSKKVIRDCFRTLYQLRDKWRPYMPAHYGFHHLSMGMSNDYPIAIEEGATLLRLGTLIFGH